MLELSNEQIGGWVGQFLLPLFRIAAMFMVMPIIGTQLVPMRVRLYLALAVSVLLVPTLPPLPQVDALSLRSLLLIAEQVLIGAMFGFVLQLFFHLFAVAGQIIAMQMGLGFASMVDPTNGVSVPDRRQVSPGVSLGAYCARGTSTNGERTPPSALPTSSRRISVTVAIRPVPMRSSRGGTTSRSAHATRLCTWSRSIRSSNQPSWRR